MKTSPMELPIFIAALLFLNLGSSVLIKFSPNYYGEYFLLGGLVILLLGVYFCRTLIWLFLGKRYQLSYVYPLLSVNYVLSLFVGMLVFNEPFTTQRLVGALIILVGVFLISFSKHRYEGQQRAVSI